MNKKQLITEAFTLGFMMSREGFNAECAFEHCSDGLKPHAESEEEFREHMAENEAFQEGLEEALERMANDRTMRDNDTNIVPEPEEPPHQETGELLSGVIYSGNLPASGKSLLAKLAMEWPPQPGKSSDES